MVQFLNGKSLVINSDGYLSSGNVKIENNTISTTSGDLVLSANANVLIGGNRVATIADVGGNLGTMSTQNANNVSITGGTISGITDLAVSDGGTGASTAADARTNLGLVIGTNIQAYDATLNALAGVSTSANQLIYATGSDTFSTTSLTSFGRSLIDDNNSAESRTTLGLAIGTNVQAYDATLNALAGVSTSANQLIYATGSDTFSTTSLTSFGRSLIDDNNAAESRTTLGLGTISTQNSNNVAISGGSINGTSIGESSASTGKFVQIFPTVISNGNVSGTVGTDASAGQVFDMTITGNMTLSNPTNSIDGLTVRWRITQDSTGGYSVTLGDKFNIPSSASSPLPWSTSANKTDVLAATYHAGRDKWDVMAFVPGY